MLGIHLAGRLPASVAGFGGLLFILSVASCAGGPADPGLGTDEDPASDSSVSESGLGTEDVEVTDLGTLGGRSSAALAIDGRGHVAGRSAPDGFMPMHLFYHDGESMEDLGSLGGGHAEATDLNEDGVVVGWSELADRPMVRHAVAWIDGELVDLGTLGGLKSRALAVNERGQIVGEADSPEGRRAFLWEEGTMRDLGTLGGRSSRATDIDGRGRIVGGSETADGQHHAFLWEDGRMTDLGTLGGSESLALGTSDAGHVVGWSRTADGEVHPFLWHEGEMRDLTSSAGATFTPYAVNGDGRIVGAVEPSGEGGPRPRLLVDDELVELPTPDGSSDGRAHDLDDQGRIVGFARTGPDGDAHAVLWTVR